VNEVLLRDLIPAVTGVLVRRGADFATAEDAVQEALIRALATWPQDPPADPKGWLITVAWHKWLDAARTDSARQARETQVAAEPPPGQTSPGPAPAELPGDTDDTLRLYFLCAHPSLTPASAVALTLRAVGGLTTRQIAEAYLVPEATMAQRISRAKRTVSGVRFDEPGDLATVLHVLYLVFNEGYSGEVDLADEAIRLTRQVTAMTDDEEASGLLALMLLHHARRAARMTPAGALVPLGEQDRSRWDTRLIAEGVAILQAALARDRLGEYQAQAAIAALHADAQSAGETDWVQIVEWYDELARLTDSPVVRLNRAVAVGEADGAQAGLAALERVAPGVPRRTAVEAHLRERAGDLALAARLYGDAARAATNQAERDHLSRQAARLHSARLPGADGDVLEAMVDRQAALLGDGDVLIGALGLTWQPQHGVAVGQQPLGRRVHDLLGHRVEDRGAGRAQHGQRHPFADHRDVPGREDRPGR
jgi:RNA polymerase sigma factor (sigma-70 family)